MLGDQLVQTGTGVFAVDVDAVAGTSDQIVVSDTAALAGKVDVSLLSIPPTAAQTFLILSSLGTTDNGLGLIASPALHAALSFPNGQDVVLGIDVDFYIDDLNPNQRAIGENIDAAFHAGVGGLRPVILGLLNTVSDDAYKAAPDSSRPSFTPTPRSLRSTRASASPTACSRPRSAAPTPPRSSAKASVCGPAPMPASSTAARRSIRSDSTRPQACSPPARRSRSTTGGGSASPAAFRRAHSTPPPMRRARARSNRAAWRSSTIRVPSHRRTAVGRRRAIRHQAAVHQQRSRPQRVLRECAGRRRPLYHQHQARRRDGARQRRGRRDHGQRFRPAPVLRRPARRDHADPKRRHQRQRKVLGFRRLATS